MKANRVLAPLRQFTHNLTRKYCNFSTTKAGVCPDFNGLCLNCLDENANPALCFAHDHWGSAAYWQGVQAASAAIVAADGRRRGATPLSVHAAGNDHYQHAVAASVAAIIAVDRVRRGVVAEKVPLPSCNRDPEYTGQDVADPDYWRVVQKAARAIIKVNDAQHGRKLTED